MARRAVARLVAGESALAPRVDVLGSDLLDPPLRERVRRRAAAWLDAHLAPCSRPLFALRDGAPPGAARGIAFALAEGLGAVPRRTVAGQVAALTAGRPASLGRLGVTLGRLGVFLPPLLQPDAVRLRARLYGIHAGRPAEQGPEGRPRSARRPAAVRVLPGLRLLPRRAARGAPRPPRARGRRRLATRAPGTVCPAARAPNRSSAAARTSCRPS